MMCDKCIHNKVCCDEGKNDNGMMFCANFMEERKCGEWIEKGENDDGTHNIVCSVCNNGVKAKGHAKSCNTIKKWKFCPSCGAIMRK